MAINEKATASVELDGQQAENELKELKSQATVLRRELKELKLNKDPNYAQKKREFDELKKQIDGAKKSAFDLNTVLKNVSGSSMKDLSRAQNILNAQLRNNKRDTAAARIEFAAKTKQLQAVRGELTRVNTEVRGLNRNMGLMAKMSNGFNKYFGMFAAFSASILGTVMGFKQIVMSFNDYEESVANLSAITGLQGNQLDWLSERAKEASVNVTEQGIRFKNSAKDIVDAYTMVGSQRPELLANREALASVTEEAMILSRAAKIELAPAATALTTVMNQFNEPADQARRIINALGAGSKVGAGNVAYLNSVIEKSGTSAKNANLGVEELIGTIEGIAPKFSEPAQAGTMLRNVFIRLQTLDDDLNPTIVGWSKSLENLAARQYNASEITKLFGMESFNMVQALIDGRADIEKYTEAVTDSSVAMEQAAINSDTNAARLETARNNATLLRMELGEKLAPALTFSTNGFSYLLKTIKSVIDNWETYRQVLILGIALILAYRWEMVKATAANIANNISLQAGIGLKAKEAIVMQALLIKEAALTGWRVKGTIATKAASAAQRVFNLVVSQFPGFAIVAAITAMVGVIKLWDKYNAAAIARQREQNDLLNMNNTLTGLATERAKEAADAVQTLSALTVAEKNALYNLNNEKIRQIEIDLQQMKVNQAQAVESAATVTMWQSLTALAKGAFLGMNTAVNDIGQSVVDNMGEAGSKFDETINQTAQALEMLKGANKELNDVMTAEARANAIAGDSITALEEKVNLYNLALRNAVIGSEDYNRIKGLLSETQQTLNLAMQDGTLEVNESTNAYTELTTAISNANNAMKDFSARGMFDDARNMQTVIDGLETQKLVLDGIIAAGGDVDAFLDSLTNADVAAMEERNEANEAFFETYNAKHLEAQEQKRLAAEQELAWELQNFETKMEHEKRIKEAKIQMEKDTQRAREDITDAALAEGFNMYAMYSAARLDRDLSDLQSRREKELSNTNLTEAQRLKIEEKYRAEEAKMKLDAWKKQRNADALQSVINTAISVSRALAAPPGFPFNTPFVIAAGALGAIQTAAILAQPVPQFFGGRYPVRGATDGFLYNAQWAGEPKTGIYTTPSLIADRGSELIIDAPTTRNLQVNHPEIIEGIMANRVPQYNTGRYPETPATGSGAASVSTNTQNDALLKDVHATLLNLNNSVGKLSIRLDNPIRANVSLLDIDDMSNKRDQAENDTSY